MKKIIFFLYLIFFSFPIYAEIVVCKLNLLSHTSDFEFTSKQFEYKYFDINDFTKTIKIIKKLEHGIGLDRFVYLDEDINKLIPYLNPTEIHENPLKVLHFTEEEIIYSMTSQEEIGESNKETDKINEENKGGNIYQFGTDIHYIFQLDRIMGFHLTTGILVNKDGTYKLSEGGHTRMLINKTEPCYGKNFIKFEK